MAYPLPFLGKGEREAQKLHPRYRTQTPPASQPLIPSTPPPLGGSVYESWLAEDRAQKDVQLDLIPGRTQPQAYDAQTDPMFAVDRPRTMADRIREYERADSPYGDERRTFVSQEPEDSFLAEAEPKTRLSRTEVAERFGVLSPDVERGLIATGQIEPPAPTTRTKEYEWLPDQNRWAAPPMDEITDPGFEEFTSGQWVSHPVTDREGVTTQELIPTRMAQELARRTGLGDQPDRPTADVFGAVEFIARPFEVWGQTVTELFKQIPTVMRGDFGDLEAPTVLTEGFMAAHEKYRDKPIWQQIVLGILTDPVVMIKGLSIGAKLTRAAYGADLIPLVGLFRSQVAQAAYDGGHSLGDDAMDEIAETLADTVLTVSPQEAVVAEVRTSRGWQRFLKQGEDVGIFEPVRTKTPERLKILEEFGLVVDSHVNELAYPLRNLADVIDEVDVKEGIRGKIAGFIVGPSVARTTAIGKLATAVQRQRRSADQLVQVAMAAAFDSHLGQLDNVLPVDSSGIWKGTKLPWQRIFEAPDSFSRDIVSDEARALIMKVNQMTNDEAARLLDDVGITQKMRARPADEYYVPRNVQEIRGVVLDKRGGVNFEFRRHYDDITEGVAAGVQYGTTPRDDIELYMKWVYRKVANKQLDDALEMSSVSKHKLIGEDIQAAMDAAAKNRKDLNKSRTTLAGRIASMKVDMKVTTAAGVPKAAQLKELQAQLAQIDEIINDLPSILPVGEEPARQSLEIAQRNLTNAIRLEKKAADELSDAESLLASKVATGKAAASELSRLESQYQRLVELRDEMVSHNRYFQGKSGEIEYWGQEVFPVLPRDVRASEQAQSKFRTLGVELTAAGRRVESAKNRADKIGYARVWVAEIVDDLKDDLADTRLLIREAQDSLRVATRAESKTQAGRGAAKTRATLFEQQRKRIARRTDVAGRRVGTVESAKRAIETKLEFLKGQQDNIDRQLDDLMEGRGAYEGRGYKQAKADRSTALESLESRMAPGELWGPNQPVELTFSAWRGKFLPQSEVDLLEAALGKQAEPGIFTKTVQSLVNVKRSLAATLDAAEPFIQGLPIMADNPKNWGIQTARHYQALFDPAIQGRLIRDNVDDYAWLAQHNVPIGDPEFFAALRKGEGLSFDWLFKKTHTEQVQRYFRFAGRQSFGRFSAMYNTGLGTARVQILQAVKPSWKGTDAELAQYIRNLTGGLDARALGVGPQRTAAEGLWLAFSPRLLRSTIALVYDSIATGVPAEMIPKVIGYGAKEGTARDKLAKGMIKSYSSTPQGRRALRTLGTLAAGAATTYIVTGWALGKNWDEIRAGLNPLNGKRFLSHQINGDWIGVGGQIRALTQMMAALAVDPSSLLEGTRRDNPILAFLSGRGAIGLSAALQAGEASAAMVGGEANLDPFERVDGWTDFFKLQGTGSLPFTIQGHFDGESGLTTVASLLGLRTGITTEYDIMREARGIRQKQVLEYVADNDIEPDKIYEIEWNGETITVDQSKPIAEFADLQPADQVDFRNKYPSSFDMYDEQIRSLAAKGDTPWATERVRVMDMEDEMVSEQEKDDAKFADGSVYEQTMGAKDWITAHKKRVAKLFAQREVTYEYDVKEPESVLDFYYAKLREIANESAESVGDTLEEDDTGAMNYSDVMTSEGWDKLNAWVRSQNDDFQDTVKRNTGLNAPTAQSKDYDRAMDIIGERYYDAVEDLLAYPEAHNMTGIRFEDGTILELDPDDAYMYLRIRDKTEKQQKFEITVLPSEEGTPEEVRKEGNAELVRDVERQIRKYKESIRMGDNELNDALFKYDLLLSEDAFIIQEVQGKLTPP